MPAADVDLTLMIPVGPKRRPHRPRRGMSRGRCRQGLEIILTRSGVSAGGSLPGAGARRACAWRSIFWKARISPGWITTASSEEAPVQRGFPPSMRSIVMVSGALAEGLGRDLAGRHDGEIGVP
jgi:hypothetical protein